MKEFTNQNFEEFEFDQKLWRDLVFEIMGSFKSNKKYLRKTILEIMIPVYEACVASSNKKVDSMKEEEVEAFYNGQAAKFDEKRKDFEYLMRNGKPNASCKSISGKRWGYGSGIAGLVFGSVMYVLLGDIAHFIFI